MFVHQDDEGISFHGVAYVDMSPLIYPGGKSQFISQVSEAHIIYIEKNFTFEY